MTSGASPQPAKTCLSRKPGNQEKSDHGFLASEFPSSAFLRVSWFPAQILISVVKLSLLKVSRRFLPMQLKRSFVSAGALGALFLSTAVGLSHADTVALWL